MHFISVMDTPLLDSGYISLESGERLRCFPRLILRGTLSLLTLGGRRSAAIKAGKNQET